MGMKLDELAERAGVSPRTVRYYIQRGVLPAPDFQGPHTAYDERHLSALRAIKRLQEAYWPLDAIAAALAGKSESELRELSHGALPALPDPSKTSRPTAPEPSHPKPIVSVRGERLTLAPGVELWVEDGADAALVQSIVKLSQTHTRTSHKPKGKP